MILSMILYVVLYMIGAIVSLIIIQGTHEKDSPLLGIGLVFWPIILPIILIDYYKNYK